MNEKRKATIKDQILKLLIEDGLRVPDHSKIANNLNEDPRFIKYLCEEMEKDGVVELEIVTLHNSDTLSPDYLVRQTNKGVFFYSFDGGYYENYKSTVREKRWIIAKTVAATLNAIAILAKAFFSLYFSYFDENQEKEKVNTELQKKEQANSPAQENQAFLL